jgi:hypothetical protein
MGMYMRSITQKKLSLKRFGHELRGVEEIHPKYPHVGMFECNYSQTTKKVYLAKNANKMHL